jgi:hypothetical protein
MRQRLTKESRQSGAPSGGAADRVVVVFDTIAIFVAKNVPKSAACKKAELNINGHGGRAAPAPGAHAARGAWGASAMRCQPRPSRAARQGLTGMAELRVLVPGRGGQEEKTHKPGQMWKIRKP